MKNDGYIISSGEESGSDYDGQKTITQNAVDSKMKKAFVKVVNNESQK